MAASVRSTAAARRYLRQTLTIVVSSCLLFRTSRAMYQSVCLITAVPTDLSRLQSRYVMRFANGGTRLHNQPGEPFDDARYRLRPCGRHVLGSADRAGKQTRPERFGARVAGR